MARSIHWNPIVEKFQAKLSKWKENTLSFGGRLTLCKSVLSSLGSFYFSLFKAPVKVIKRLERIRMRFFRGGDMDSKKKVWIAWDKTLTAIDKGVMGIGSLKAQNLALMGKWWWKFKVSNNDMWVEVIKSIYGSDGGFHRPSVAKRRSGCRGSIANIPKELEKENMPFLEHFKEVPNNDGPIRWGWSLDPSGTYTVSSLRCFIDSSTLPQSDVKWVWNSLVPGKVNILAWRIRHGKLPTMGNLFKTGIS